MNRRPAALASVALVVVVTAVFWPTLGNEFIDLDDAARITENPQLEHLSLETVRWAFSVEAQRLYVQQPLTWLSFALDHAVFGPDPAGFHAVNLALHALTAVLVLLLLWRLTAALGPSVAAAALFALHPLTVEPVAWAS